MNQHDLELTDIISKADTILKYELRNTPDDTDQAKQDARKRIDGMVSALVPEVKDNGVNIITVDTIAKMRSISAQCTHELTDVIIDIRAYAIKPNRIKLIAILTSLGFIFKTIVGLYNTPWYISNTDLGRASDMLVLTNTLSDVGQDLRQALLIAEAKLKELPKDEHMDDHLMDTMRMISEKLFSLLATMNIYITTELHMYIEDDATRNYPKRLDSIIKGSVFGGLAGMVIMTMVHFLLHM